MKQNSMQNLSFKNEVTNWFTQKPALLHLFDVLTESGYAPRFVGGCVRDVVFNSMGYLYEGGAYEVRDFDIAVPCPPATTTEILQSAGITVIPTGLDFGSITAVIDGDNYEITSLRQDVQTDGRRAVVSYTTDWEIDAHRRDFTINAMSMDRDGTLYDYCGGMADAQAQVVRFVGDADLRVREDILRILRYYRFAMVYGKTNDTQKSPNPATLNAWQACQTHAPKINHLSRERIWGEMARILSIVDIDKITNGLGLMHKHHVLSKILPENKWAENTWDKDKFQKICQKLNKVLTPKDTSKNTIAIARLVILHQGTQHPRDICLKHLCISKAENHIWDILQCPIEGKDTGQLYHSLDTYGPAYTHARLILWGQPITEAMLSEINGFEEQPFPLSGSDIMALGIPAGRQVGVLLQQAKRHWYDSKCTLQKAQLLSCIQVE